MEETNLKRPCTAVIGVGSLGQHHVKVLKSLDNNELVGISDIDESRGRQIADKFGVKYYKDYRELLSLVDAVSIVVSTPAHYEVAKFFLENGVHTLIEKPITTTVEEAKKLISIARKNNCLVQVGHIERFNPAVMKLKEVVNNPMYIEIDRLGPFSKRSLEVGVVLDLMIHDIDIILSLVPNRILRMDAIGVPVFTPYEDIANVRLTFDNYSLADLSASRVTPDGQRKLRIYQPEGYITLNYENQEIYAYQMIEEEESNSGEKKRELVFNTYQVLPGEPLRLELKHFINCVINNLTPEVSGEHGRNALEIALEITNKIKENWEKTLKRPFS